VLREIHTRLVQQGVRDEVTLIVSGGIALAEHMAKAIICGADLVAVDTSLLVALGCRVCRGAAGRTHEEECAAEAGNLDRAYAAQRMVNLMGAWHSQLLEVLGAMGIREVRRLRGEVGRAIFMEDIEREAFGDLACK
jgi:glutamate synthase domain-containing protein 2